MFIDAGEFPPIGTMQYPAINYFEAPNLAPWSMEVANDSHFTILGAYGGATGIAAKGLKSSLDEGLSPLLGTALFLTPGPHPRRAIGHG